MSDLIDRQALLKQIDIDSDGEPGYYGDTWKFIDTIKNMPNVHDLPKDTDTISRAKAIEALKQQAETMSEWSNRYAEQRKGILTAVNIVEDLPPAQPERIVHCKDCEWWTKQECSPQGRCALFGMYPTGGWFCGNARMREVTT